MPLNFCNQLHWYLQPGSLAGALGRHGHGESVTDVCKALVGGTGDGGVDGIIDQDRLGLDCIYVQAKRYLAQGRESISGKTFEGSTTD
jgi:restriction endonuclease Mrr